MPRRDYLLTLVRPSGQRFRWYTGRVYRTLAAAQRECTRLNARERRGGDCVVESIPRSRTIATLYVGRFPTLSPKD